MTMTFPKAKEEYEVRYYLWATSEWEKEIEQTFPNLRTFKAGSAWRTYQYMQRLGKREQMILARGLLKRFHPGAVKTLGETCSPDEDAFRWRRDEFFRIRQEYQWVRQLEETRQTEEARFLFQRIRGDAITLLGEIYPAPPGPLQSQYDASLRSQLDALFRPVPLTFEEKLAARKKAGEKVRFVGKRKLQEAIMERFKTAFGNQCVDSGYDDIGDPSSWYDMKCCGWILRSHFWFGRSQSLINYSHGIASPTVIHNPDHPEITAPAMLLAQGISFCAWLGITSQIQWEYLTKDDFQAVCDGAIEQCRHFFEIVPKLLVGLEFEKITAN